MPQIFHVGYRSPLVSGLAWLLILSGIAALAGVGFLIGSVHPLLLAAQALASILAVSAGHGLLHRFEWGRRLSLALLLGAIPALPLLPWLTGSNLLLGLLSLAISATLVWPLLALVSRDVRQEFV